MWLSLLSNKVALIIIGTLLAIVLVAGIEIMVYRWGGNGQRADDALAVIKTIQKEAKADADIDKKTPFNANRDDSVKWLYAHTSH